MKLFFILDGRVLGSTKQLVFLLSLLRQIGGVPFVGNFLHRNQPRNFGRLVEGFNQEIGDDGHEHGQGAVSDYFVFEHGCVFWFAKFRCYGGNSKSGVEIAAWANTQVRRCACPTL